MDFFGAFVSSILSLIVYVVVFMGVYKLYYIAKDIHEIKELMERKLGKQAAGGLPARAVVSAATPGLTQGLSDEDAASAYAEQLLRVVNAEPARRASETQEVR